MRKAYLLGAAVALGLSAQSAKADVYTDIVFTKAVDIDIAETITKTKTVNLVVFVNDDPELFAESQAVFNQSQFGNEACTNCDEKIDRLINSGNRNTGIVSMNQAGGNMVNQGTTISVAFVDASGNFVVGSQATAALVDQDPPPPPRDPNNTAFAHSQANGDQTIISNTIETVNIIFRTAVVRDSVNNNSGIAAFNQGTGNILNQQNAISIAAAVADGVALSDATLGQTSAINTVTEYAIRKDATLVNSMRGNSGIVQGNQSVGNFGNQANVVSISAVGVQ